MSEKGEKSMPLVFSYLFSQTKLQFKIDATTMKSEEHGARFRKTGFLAGERGLDRPFRGSLQQKDQQLDTCTQQIFILYKKYEGSKAKGRTLRNRNYLSFQCLREAKLEILSIVLIFL
jgi:hypothetical protein